MIEADLYYNKFSICSLMVRYTFSLRGEPKSANDQIQFHEKQIDIHNGEQFTENYLLNVNPKGQVPVLFSESLTNPITDSLDITFYLEDFYPSLAPPPHKDIVNELLKELHTIAYVNLSFPPGEVKRRGTAEIFEKLLGQPNISDEYLKALKFKKQFHEQTFAHVLEPETIALTKEKSLKFFKKISSLRDQFAAGGLWIFGDKVGPTALDAHAVVYIARLVDAQNSEFIPEGLVEYGRKAIARVEWKNMMQGRQTLPG